MEEKLVSLLDEYFDKFGKIFPLSTAPGFAKAISHIEESLKQDKTVEELFPQYYGKLEGKVV